MNGDAAIRVRKGGKGERYTWHWLLDPGRTYCGLHVDDLQVVEELERESLPSVEACRGCERTKEGWIKPKAQEERELRFTAPPAPGRMRTTGSLSHGFRRRGGRRL